MLALLLISGVSASVYAAVNYDFSVKAQAWVKSNCNNKTLQSKTSASALYAAICDNHYTNIAQDNRIIAAQNSIIGLNNNFNNTSLPTLTDKDGNVLGTVLGVEGENISFYLRQHKRVVTIDKDGYVIPNMSISDFKYAEPDCKGTKFLVVSPLIAYTKLLHFNDNPGNFSGHPSLAGQYVIVGEDNPKQYPKEYTAQSYYNGNQGCINTEAISYKGYENWMFYGPALPSIPIKTPINIK